MKFFKHFIFMLCSLGVSAQADERSEWFAERRAWIEQAKNAKNPETIQNLARIVKGVGRNLDQASLGAKDLFYQAKEQLLSIPGHAKYFADQVAAARSKSKDIVTDRNYHEACERLRDTLPHLPDPETVQVLGQMLESRADVPTLEQELEVSRMRMRGGDYEEDCVWYYPSRLGGVALLSLGIRNMPPGPDQYGQIRSYDEKWLRAWWDEIKSGKRTFSFKGQSVEYRFKPDGTWETIAVANPPDDAPNPETSKSEANRPKKNPPPSLPAPESTAPLAPAPSASAFSYGWVIGCGILVLAALAVFLKRRHAPK